MSLLLTCVGAMALLVFHEMIGRLPILAYLSMVIAPVVGNAGHQALAVTQRGIVLDEVRKGRVGPLIGREVTVGVLIGLALGATMAAALGLLSYVPQIQGASWQLGLVAGTCMTVAMASATLAGVTIPLIMRRLGIDPAHASSIMLILITDAISITVLLSLVVLLSAWLPEA